MLQLQQTVGLVQAALLPFSQTDSLVKQCLEDEQFQAFLASGRGGATSAAMLQEQGEQPFTPMDAVAGSQSSNRASAGFSQVVGMLRQMRDNFKADLADIEDTETKARTAYDNLVASKTEEISTDVEQVQKLTEEKSGLAIQLSRDQHDLIDTQKTLAEDEKFFQDMKVQCQTKEQEWQERSNMRLQEMTAMNEAADLLMEDE